MAIAGPVKSNKIEKFANMDWEGIDGNSLIERFNFKKCFILNDFEAVGHSFPALNLDDFHPIKESNENIKNKKENNLIIGLGSGMGVCYIVKTLKNRFLINPTESGHFPYPVCNEEDQELLSFIKKKMKHSNNRFLSQEYILSGTGIPQLYEFLVQKHKNLKESDLSAEAIFDKLTKTNEMTPIFVSHYIKYIAYTIESMYKIYMPHGGNILIGGVAYVFFKKFFNLDKELFWKQMKPFFYTDKVFFESYKKMNLYIFPEHISELAVIGAITKIRNYLNIYDVPKTGKKDDQAEVIDLLPLTYFDNILNRYFLSFKGLLEQSKKSYNNIFLVKIKSQGIVEEFRVESGTRFYRKYLVNSLNSNF